ncbi:translation elongation factor Ts [Buchnera aphidicola]|uniref:translation elongation factor Ts n=1 Tax=Buchnera aphidicola TaxID=9 RepID=UPI0031B87EDF
MNIKISLIKKLRKLTGLGVYHCKKALLKNNNDIDDSINYLRKIGELKVYKKISNKVFNGAVFVEVNKNSGAILKLSCETDFVSRNILFIEFGKKIINYMILNKNGNINFLKDKFNKSIKKLIVKFNENIIIKKCFYLQSNNILSCYLHGNKIAVLVEGKKCSLKMIKKIAMHIAASNPEYISIDDVPKKIIKDEYNIQMKIALNEGKSLNISENIVKGRMKKFINNITLMGQDFIFENKKSVYDILSGNNSKILSFIRYKI